MYDIKYMSVQCPQVVWIEMGSPQTVTTSNWWKNSTPLLRCHCKLQLRLCSWDTDWLILLSHLPVWLHVLWCSPALMALVLFIVRVITICKKIFEMHTLRHFPQPTANMKTITIYMYSTRMNNHFHTQTLTQTYMLVQYTIATTTVLL